MRKHALPPITLGDKFQAFVSEVEPCCVSVVQQNGAITKDQSFTLIQNKHVSRVDLLRNVKS